MDVLHVSEMVEKNVCFFRHRVQISLYHPQIIEQVL